MRRKYPTESQVQKAFFQQVRMLQPANDVWEMVMATPNQDTGNENYRMNMANEGMAAGFPDISVLLPRMPFHGLYIELKVGRNKPTKKQIAWLYRLQRKGYLAVCIRTYDWFKLFEFVSEYIDGKENYSKYWGMAKSDSCEIIDLR